MKRFWLVAALTPWISNISWAGEPPGGVRTTTTSADIEIDPVTDTALLSASLGFGLLLELVVRTGELRPQQPVDSSVLLAIDRWRADSDFVQDDDLSSIALGVLGALAIADVVLAELLNRDDWIDYFVVYGESAAITLGLTNLAKIAVRRPRPEAYRQARNGEENGDTNTALSFFSGHAAMAGALAGTAAYLAWARGDALEAWLVSVGGGLLAVFTSAMRVVEGKHFPTDVIAGSIIGAAVGVLIPHFHRQQSVTLQPSVVEDGVALGLRARF